MRNEAHTSDWFVMLLVPSAEVVSVGYARANQSTNVTNMLSVRPTDLWLALFRLTFRDNVFKSNPHKRELAHR
jgi:hypothetical protein